MAFITIVALAALVAEAARKTGAEPRIAEPTRELPAACSCGMSSLRDDPRFATRRSRLAVFSLLVDDEPGAAASRTYEWALRVLGFSLKKHLPPTVPRYLMTRAEDERARAPRDSDGRVDADLRRFWRRCACPGIYPPAAWTPGTVRFRGQFIKLHFWRMVDFERVMYFDADTLAVKDGIAAVAAAADLRHRSIACARDIYGTRWAETFNMGVVLVRPSDGEFRRLFELMAGARVKYDVRSSEQGFLNAVYDGNWTALPCESLGVSRGIRLRESPSTAALLSPPAQVRHEREPRGAARVQPRRGVLGEPEAGAAADPLHDAQAVGVRARREGVRKGMRDVAALRAREPRPEAAGRGRRLRRDRRGCDRCGVGQGLREQAARARDRAFEARAERPDVVVDEDGGSPPTGGGGGSAHGCAAQKRAGVMSHLYKWDITLAREVVAFS